MGQVRARTRVEAAALVTVDPRLATAARGIVAVASVDDLLLVPRAAPGAGEQATVRSICLFTCGFLTRVASRKRRMGQ